MPVDIRSNRIEAGFFNYMDKKRIAWNKGLKGVMPVPWNKGKKTSKATKLKQSKARMGKIPWNKGMKGLQVGWNKDKKMPENFRMTLFNLILRKSSLKALQLEEEMNLPTHIQLPTLKIGDKKE